MDSRKLRIPYKSSIINITLLGRGDKVALCFHGYGQDASAFHHLAAALNGIYRLVVLDLPYHGETQWTEEAFSPNDLENILRCMETEIAPRFSVIGYSIGCMAALNFASRVRKDVEEVILMAPVNLNQSLHYRAAVKTAVGRFMFRGLMSFPKLSSVMVSFAGRIGAISSQACRLAKMNLKDRQAARLVYHRWRSMSNMGVGLKDMKELIEGRELLIRFFFGTFDSVASPEQYGLQKFPGLSASIYSVRSGHDLLSPPYVFRMADTLRQIHAPA